MNNKEELVDLKDRNDAENLSAKDVHGNQVLTLLSASSIEWSYIHRKKVSLKWSVRQKKHSSLIPSCRQHKGKLWTCRLECEKSSISDIEELHGSWWHVYSLTPWLKRPDFGSTTNLEASAAGTAPGNSAQVQHRETQVTCLWYVAPTPAKFIVQRWKIQISWCSYPLRSPYTIYRNGLCDVDLVSQEMQILLIKVWYVSCTSNTSC